MTTPRCITNWPELDHFSVMLPALLKGQSRAAFHVETVSSPNRKLQLQPAYNFRFPGHSGITIPLFSRKGSV